MNVYLDDDLYVEPLSIGVAVSDWGPLEVPSRLPWRRKRTKPEDKKPFGFARALETE